MPSSSVEGEFSESHDRAITDINGDGFTTPLDALLIINHLGSESSQQFAGVDSFLDDEDDEEDELLDLLAADVSELV